MVEVSVVMPARNAAATVVEALNSLRNQAHLAEIIIIDDGSSDDTAARAAAFGDARIRILPGPQSGISAALNMGFLAARHPHHVIHAVVPVALCNAADLLWLVKPRPAGYLSRLVLDFMLRQGVEQRGSRIDF